MRDPKRFDSNDVETAMCIWEYILEQTRQGQPENKWEHARVNEGTASLRCWATDQIDIVWNAFKIASGPDGDCYGLCFDWDFVPAFMERAYDDDLELRPEWEEIAELIGEESRA